MHRAFLRGGGGTKWDKMKVPPEHVQKHWPVPQGDNSLVPVPRILLHVHMIVG